jgi:sulfur relay (sulfurtransferase) DsrF/TusC family protein
VLNKKGYRDRNIINRLKKEYEYKLAFVYSCENHLEKTGNLSKDQLIILYKMIQDNTYIQKSTKNDVGN